MSDRRIIARRDGDDDDERRKIPRFTEHELNASLSQTQTWLRLLYALGIIVATFEFGFSLSQGIENLTQGIFFAAVFIILSVLVWKCLYVIKLFLQNHSISNLKRIHEQNNALLAYMVVLGAISYVVLVISRF